MPYAQLEKFIFEKISQTKLPGLSMSLFKGDEVVWSRGFGYRDAERGLPATDRTLYSVGSVTKSFTCLAIMQLAAQGKLSIDDPIEKYMPFDIRPHGETVRIKHFMSHTSGIAALAYAEQIISAGIGATDDWLPVATANDMLTFMQGAEDWTWAKPGERWFYFNEGYMLLGGIIHQVSGIPYEEYVQQHILAPLGMSRSFYAKSDVDADADVAIPYVNWAQQGRTPASYIYSGVDAAGGLISNVLDLAKYGYSYLNNGKPVADENIVAEMIQPRVKTPVTESPFGEEGYGYGWGIKSNFWGHPIINHGGSVGVATAYLAFIPDANIGAAVLTNGSGYGTGLFAMYGLSLLLGEDPEALPFVRNERRLAKLEGVYHTFKNTMRLEVRRAGDMLVVSEKDKFGTNSVTLIPSHIDGDSHYFYEFMNGYKIYTEFHVTDSETKMIRERYLLRKTGSVS
ncbi:MAG: serine hydrolase [Chloroflexi bacterium]|nr:serine hydrolase [Chloroflexota bacterium]MCC6896711.1 serine hydrolase [Anaerolineae bacterium]